MDDKTSLWVNACKNVGKGHNVNNTIHGSLADALEFMEIDKDIK